jgi:DNA (cytosine-5)-methyltransferase 3A
LVYLVAQTKNRETEASGLGWELFQNYVIARDKYKPDYFLYENNKSMSQAIREKITEELGVEPVLINSALVSAQNRQRLYWVGKRNPDGTYSRVDVEQPEDRGILLRDVLETGVSWKEKSYTLRAQYAKTSVANIMGGHYGAPMAAQPVNTTEDGKAQCIRATCYKDGIRNMVANDVDRRTCVAEPVCLRYERTEEGKRLRKQYEAHEIHHGYHEHSVLQPREDGKSNTLSTVLKDNQIAEPVRIGTIESGERSFKSDSQANRVYSPDGESINLCGNGGGAGGKTGLYAVPTGAAWRHQNRLCIESADGKSYPVYEVKDGLITIKDKQYPIRLRDGCYIIRKLTVTECKRLQTVPDNYEFPVSDTQAYKMLGNGWTCDVIAHIMGHFDGLTSETVEVLSMYDGMSCGRIALDKLGADVVRYYATEIDKYAVQTTQHNYPDTVQLGDAYQVRDDGWEVPR